MYMHMYMYSLKTFECERKDQVKKISEHEIGRKRMKIKIKKYEGE